MFVMVPLAHNNILPCAVTQCHPFCCGFSPACPGDNVQNRQGPCLCTPVREGQGGARGGAAHVPMAVPVPLRVRVAVNEAVRVWLALAVALEAVGLLERRLGEGVAVRGGGTAGWRGRHGMRNEPMDNQAARRTRAEPRR